MGFSKQEYWTGLPLPSPDNLPHPGIKPESSARERGFFTLSHQGTPSRAVNYHLISNLRRLAFILG